MMKSKLLVLLIIFCSFSYSQSKGTISGIIREKSDSKSPIAFVNVKLKGTNIGVTTDEKGLYTLTVNPGNYIVEFSSIGFTTEEEAVKVNSGETAIVNRSLKASGVQLSDVVVKKVASREKETAILLEQKKAVEMKQSIGAQEMSRKGASNVAAALAKTTGITKQEGSGNIYVRGLGDRYNSTTMNGLPLPSNDPSKKNIKLDIFNTDVVESVGIDKTFNVKNYGDFGGANIDIVSKNQKARKNLDFGIELGMNTQAINQDHFYLQDGPKKHGFSNITYPSDPFSGYNFNTKWNTQLATPINYAFYARGGKSIDIGDEGKFSFFTSISFDNDYSYKKGLLNGGVNTEGVARRQFSFESFAYATNTTGIANLNYKINQNNNIALNSIIINSSSQDQNEYYGIIDIFDIAADGGGFIRRSNFDRTTLYVNQLLGNHNFGEKWNLKWGVSYNKVKNVIPDRMVNTLIPLNGQNNLNIRQISDNNDSENHRFFQNLNDDELALNISADYKFGEIVEEQAKGIFTIGYSTRLKKVSFEAIQFNFDINTTIIQPVVDVKNIDGYFNQTNFTNDLFKIKTFNGGLKPQTYDGKQDIQAGFLSISYKFNPKFTVVIGTRAEYIIQNIDWGTNLGKGNNGFKPLKWLPSTNLKYELTEKQNLKFAASKTYTLPQFKERAPFQFENVGEIFFGNPKLYISTNYNADIKWEYFPKSNEVISLTVFTKTIQNPINEITVASATNDISFVNTGNKATIFGAEFEIRKNIFETKGEDKQSLNFGFNASYMNSNQDFNTQKVIDETDLNVFFSKQKGRLTGASDLLCNADISYSKKISKGKNIQATMLYNFFSDRIYALGTGGRGDLVDKAVGTLDLIIKSKLSKNISCGLNMKNITNPSIERIQEDQNVLVERYKKGVNLRLSFGYEF